MNCNEKYKLQCAGHEDGTDECRHPCVVAAEAALRRELDAAKRGQAEAEREVQLRIAHNAALTEQVRVLREAERMRDAHLETIKYMQWCIHCKECGARADNMDNLVHRSHCPAALAATKGVK